MNDTITTPDVTAVPEDFWGQINHQLARIEASEPETFSALRVILTDPEYTEVFAYMTRYGARPEHLPAAHPGHDANACHFAGSGGDPTLFEALRAVGWHVSRSVASYYYVATHGSTGATFTYIEGDVLEGDRITEEGI